MEVINPFIENDELKSRAIESLFEDKNLFKNTRLKNNDILKIVRLQLFSDYYNLTLISKLIKYILQLRISVNGLGRKEVVDIVKNNILMDAIEETGNNSRGVFR